jgi:hypothetical protein
MTKARRAHDPRSVREPEGADVGVRAALVLAVHFSTWATVTVTSFLPPRSLARLSIVRRPGAVRSFASGSRQFACPIHLRQSIGARYQLDART